MRIYQITYPTTLFILSFMFAFVFLSDNYLSAHNKLHSKLESNSLVTTTLPRDFQTIWEKTNQFYLKGLKERNIIGSSMVFIHKGIIAARSHYGYADLDTKQKVDEETIFHWASITKTFTGIAIIQLRDRGLLKLDNRVVDYLPELDQVHNPYGSMKDITIKHLLSHTSGFRASTWPWGGDKDWHPYEPLRWEQLKAMFPYTEILFNPGSRYSYSNPAIIFLGKIIEQISGEDYEVYIDKNILKPLNMYHTYFDITPYHLLNNRSNSYFIKDNLIEANGFDFNTGVTVSNGGLNAPIVDMVKYLTWLTNNSSCESEILNRRSLNEMWKPQIIVQKYQEYKKSVGLSFFVYDYKDLTLVGHTGEQRGFISFIIIHPTTATAALVVFNSTDIVEQGTSNTKHFSTQLQNILCKDIFPLFIEDEKP